MRNNILFLLLLLLFLFQTNLLSLITSRIEGRVLDEDTLEPIPGAEVYLAHDRTKVNLNIEKGNTVIPYEWVKITDENGYFKYDNLIESEYLICVEKEGYTSIGPFRKELEDNRERPIWRDRSIRFVKPGTRGIIHLKQGEIKYFEIKLAKDAALGYPGKTYQVQLEKGKTSIIEHILDYTKGPVIYGVIKNKTTGEIINNLSIYLYDSLNNEIHTETNYNGEYWLGGFMPGDVKMSVFRVGRGIDDNFHLNIGSNEIREFNLEY